MARDGPSSGVEDNKLILVETPTDARELLLAERARRRLHDRWRLRRRPRRLSAQGLSDPLRHALSE
jgi:hypothetical protein